MNWGTRIAVLYLGFVALILTLAFTCFGQKSELESKDYYARELKYQSRIDAETNANGLGTAIAHLVENRSVQLSVPAELLGADMSGAVQFIRPSDASLDRSIPIHTDAEGHQTLSDASFQKGVYKMQISIHSKGKDYYKESVVFFN